MRETIRREGERKVNRATDCTRERARDNLAGSTLYSAPRCKAGFTIEWRLSD